MISSYHCCWIKFKYRWNIVAMGYLNQMKNWGVISQFFPCWVTCWIVINLYEYKTIWYYELQSLFWLVKNYRQHSKYFQSTRHSANNGIRGIYYTELSNLNKVSWDQPYGRLILIALPKTYRQFRISQKPNAMVVVLKSMKRIFFYYRMWKTLYSFIIKYTSAAK